MAFYVANLLITQKTSINEGETSPVVINKQYIFRGNKNIFNSIWCDSKASLKAGTIYVGREEDLTILKVKDSQASIEDYYSKSIAGRVEETLNHEDSTDINVTYQIN